MPLIHLSSWRLILINILAWGIIQWGAGYLTFRLPRHRLKHDAWLFRLRSWEQGGHIYRRYLGIHQWKKWLPDGADFFAASFPKRHLSKRTATYLDRFVVETVRAELTHWIPLLAWPFFILWNPYHLMPFMLLYAVLANLPCLLLQRYNRPRLLTVLALTRSRTSR